MWAYVAPKVGGGIGRLSDTAIVAASFQLTKPRKARMA